MPVEVMLRDLTKLSGCNLCDRTQISACDRIFMPGKIGICSMRYFLLCNADQLSDF